MNMTVNLHTSLSVNLRLGMSLSGFPGGISGKESTWQSTRHKEASLILWQEDPLEKGMGYHSGILQQFSCLENPMDRGAWQATVLTVAKSDTTETT